MNTETSSSALCSAASTDDMEQLKRLVENRAAINAGDYDKRTPLHLAAAEGHDKAAEYLLDQKADPCVLDRYLLHNFSQLCTKCSEVMMKVDDFETGHIGDL